MSLEKTILKLKPREESGSKTARKYAFQKNLSLYLLLKEHEKRKDYVFLFDFHDDLVILDSPLSPSKIDFYQMKSKDSGNWTVNALTTADKGELSILGKLYLNKINFSSNTNTLNFITNANFSFKKLANGDDSLKKNTIKANELEQSLIDSCSDCIKKEHSLKGTIDFKDLTHFHVTILSNDDSSTHCLGELSKLINRINPENKINSELAYNQVFNEVSRRTENTFGDKSFTDFGQLLEVKGITKEQFLQFLEKAGLYKSVEDEWDEINSSLQASNVGHLELLWYRKSWRDVAATLIKDSNKIPLQKLKNEIESIIDCGIGNGEINNLSKLLDIVNYCYSKISKTLYEEYFIKCLIIRMINER